MPEAFKNNFNADVINNIAHYLSEASHKHKLAFDDESFVKQASNELDTLELKARSNQIAAALDQHMPADFGEAVILIESALAPPSKDETIQFTTDDKGLAGWMMMPITDYIAEASLRDNAKYFTQGLDLLHACTQRFSAEFSIRPFLRDHASKTLDVLATWATDQNVHVRRLVSEGSRPYLPWGLRLQAFAKDPTPILPLLAQLKDDPSEYVRRSVANNLNDIAKDHPDKVVEIVSTWWDEGNKDRTRLIKHACRTLIKDGHSGALALFGYTPAKLGNLTLFLSQKVVNWGGEQEITLFIQNQQNRAQNLLIDYAMHHQKANGKMSPKVFKWTSLILKAGEQKTLTKKHSFKPVTTRKYYAGSHKVEILVNGKAFAADDFELK
jgi:3-methyladenine DNA glycosylase AlkC